MKQRLSIRLPETLWNKLEAAARCTGLSKNQLVLDALERRYAARGAGDSGIMRLAGIMRGPRNLSTHKGYRRNQREVIPYISPED